MTGARHTRQSVSWFRKRRGLGAVALTGKVLLVAERVSKRTGGSDRAPSSGKLYSGGGYTSAVSSAVETVEVDGLCLPSSSSWRRR